MPLKIYANESVHVGVAAGLIRRGVKAESALESGNLGLTDEEQLGYASARKAVIFTHDSDFLRLAQIWATKKKVHWGIIFVSQTKIDVGECIRRLKEISEVFNPDGFKNHVEFL
jgi:predicted nuclease of predicted toxin-antitoxin system